jgi:hypothetical protein
MKTPRHSRVYIVNRRDVRKVQIGIIEDAEGTPFVVLTPPQALRLAGRLGAAAVREARLVL